MLDYKKGTNFQKISTFTLSIIFSWVYIEEATTNIWFLMSLMHEGKHNCLKISVAKEAIKYYCSQHFGERKSMLVGSKEPHAFFSSMLQKSVLLNWKLITDI